MQRWPVLRAYVCALEQAVGEIREAGLLGRIGARWYTPPLPLAVIVIVTVVAAVVQHVALQRYHPRQRYRLFQDRVSTLACLGRSNGTRPCERATASPTRKV